MGKCSKLFTVVFVISSVILGAVGLTLVVVGALIKADGGQFLLPLFKDMLKVVCDLPAQYNLIQAASTATSGCQNINVGEIVHEACIVAIVLGAAMIVVALLGGIGVYLRIKGLYILYAVVLGVILVTQLILVTLFWLGLLDESIKKTLLDGLRRYFLGLTDMGTWSLGWNYLMVRFECCGLDSYLDFKDSSWRQQVIRNVGGFPTISQISTPVACCRLTGTFPNLRAVTPDLSCAQTPTDSISNSNKGCFKAINEYLLNYKATTIAIMITILVFQFIVWLRPVILACSMSDDVKNDVSETSSSDGDDRLEAQERAEREQKRRQKKWTKRRRSKTDPDVIDSDTAAEPEPEVAPRPPPTAPPVQYSTSSLPPRYSTLPLTPQPRPVTAPGTNISVIPVTSFTPSLYPNLNAAALPAANHVAPSGIAVSATTAVAAAPPASGGTTTVAVSNGGYNLATLPVRQ